MKYSINTKCKITAATQIPLTIAEPGNSRFKNAQMTIQAIVNVGETEATIGFFKSANVCLNVKMIFNMINIMIRKPIEQKALPTFSKPSENNRLPNETVPNINPHIGIGTAFKNSFIEKFIKNFLSNL